MSKKDKVSTGLHLDIPGRITATFLELPRSLSYNDWSSVLKRLAQVHDASNFWLGDCLAHGEHIYGETYAQAASECKINEDRLQALIYVSERVRPESRMRELSWSCHREIAKLDRKQQTSWLTKCIKQGWSLPELKEALLNAGLRKLRSAGKKTKEKTDEPKLGAIIHDGTYLLPVTEVDTVQEVVCKSCNAPGYQVIVACESCYAEFENWRSQKQIEERKNQDGTTENPESTGSPERENNFGSEPSGGIVRNGARSANEAHRGRSRGKSKARGADEKAQTEELP